MRISDWSSDVCSSDLTVPQVRRAIAAVLEQLGIRDAHVQAHAHGWRDLEARPLTAGGTIRPAYFFSGCPHTTSPRPPDGALALGGRSDERRVGKGCASQCIPRWAPLPLTQKKHT